MRDQPLYVADIVAAIDFAVDFVKGLTFDEFMADEKTKSAVIQKLLIIGEASKSLGSATRNIDASIPWKIMAGMRDRLAHGYFGTDYAIVWRVVRVELPPIRPKLQAILKSIQR